MIALAFTSSSRASSLIRTWFTSVRTLPLLPDPCRASLPPAQPRPHPLPSASLPLVSLRPFPLFRQPSPLPQPASRRLRSAFPWLPQALWPRQPLRRRLHKSGSPPDKFYLPSFRLCPEFPSVARESSPRASRLCWFPPLHS